MAVPPELIKVTSPIVELFSWRMPFLFLIDENKLKILDGRPPFLYRYSKSCTSTRSMRESVPLNRLAVTNPLPGLITSLLTNSELLHSSKLLLPRVLSRQTKKVRGKLGISSSS
jgi:hypothetical protein